MRPTFSESWYRVAGLRVKLRATAQISRQFYRGERWYVVRDPAGNQFHRLSDAAYAFVGLLDGTRTVEQAWEICGGQLADDSPTQPEVIQILSQLYSANLIEADITPDATVLLRRHKQRSQRKLQGRLMNVLFPRLPLWNPDQFLCRWRPVAEVVLSKLGAIVWLVVVGLAVAMLTPQWGNLKAAAIYAVDFQNNAVNYLWLWVMFVFVKLLHELGHAFACRRFGGEVHELGIMFLVFIPTPYVDASTAWAFPSRWARMFVGAAGMVVELFFASLAAFVWLATAPHAKFWGVPVNDLAYNAMLIASVSTVLFNANPLLRYDGYYMLSDFLEIPNLRQKSTEYAMGLIKRHIFQVKSTQPLPPVVQRIWLLLYAVTSTIYRTFIGLLIILIVIDQVPVLGVLMAVGGVITWVAVPVGKLLKYLMLEPELHRKRMRATGFVVAMAAVAVVLLGLIPFPDWVEGEGVLEPAQYEMLNMKTPGFVARIEAKDGDMLQDGQIILICENETIASLVRQLEARKAAVQTAIKRAAAGGDQAQRMVLEYELKPVEKQLEEASKRLAELTVRAPIAGRLIAPTLGQLMGKYLQPGEAVAQVAQIEGLVVEATLDQRDAQLAKDQSIKKLKSEIRLVSNIGTMIEGARIQEIPAAQHELKHPALGQAGGGEIALDPRDPKGLKAQGTVFSYRVWLDNPKLTYLPGQRAYVRFKLESKPLYQQWGRRVLQLLQMRLSNTKWI